MSWKWWNRWRCHLTVEPDDNASWLHRNDAGARVSLSSSGMVILFCLVSSNFKVKKCSFIFWSTSQLIYAVMSERNESHEVPINCLESNHGMLAESLPGILSVILCKVSNMSRPITFKKIMNCHSLHAHHFCIVHLPYDETLVICQSPGITLSEGSIAFFWTRTVHCETFV